MAHVKGRCTEGITTQGSWRPVLLVGMAMPVVLPVAMDRPKTVDARMADMNMRMALRILKIRQDQG